MIAGPAAAALAAPFGGAIAAAVVAISAGASLVLLAGPATDLAVAEILVGVLAGIAVVEGLRRAQTGLGPLHFILLAGLVPVGCLGVILFSTADLGTLPATTMLSLMAVLPAAVMIVGLLLLRSDEREARAAAMISRFKGLAGSVSGVLVQIAVKRSGEIGFPYLSPGAVRLLGVMAGEASADPAKVLEVIYKADRDGVVRSLNDAARASGPWSHGFRIVQPGGRIRWLRGHLPAHVRPNGEILFDGVLVDVTSHEETEAALRWNEELCRFVFENTSEIIARIGADDRWTYVPPSIRYVLGYDPAELIGQPSLNIVHPNEAARVREALRGFRRGGTPLVMTYRARTRDGLYVWIEDSRRMAGHAGPHASPEHVGVMRRLDGSRSTELPTVLLQLPRRPGSRKGRFARMVEATSAGVMVSDPHRRDNPITFANTAAVAITGYEAAELSGRNARILQGPGTDRATVAEISTALQAERPVSTTILNYRKDGTPFWSKLRISPVHGADGQLEAFVCVFFEVTEEKRLEEALRQACDVAEQANRAKSEFIANISHELRTPLNGVIGFTNLLLNENLPAEQRRYATFARDAGSSLLAIINNVLDLSKIEAGKLELSETDFSVIELAVSCNTVVWHAAREKGLDLNFVLKPDVMNVCRGDPDRIRQVLLNFLSNAIKFTEKRQCRPDDREGRRSRGRDRPHALGDRYRRRHSAREARPPLPEILADRRGAKPPARRDRARPCDLQEPRRADGRRDRREEHAGRRQQVLVHGAAEAGAGSGISARQDTGRAASARPHPARRGYADEPGADGDAAEAGRARPYRRRRRGGGARHREAAILRPHPDGRPAARA